MVVKRKGSRSKARPIREPVKRILVVTEGERTEPQYVERLNAHLRSTRTTPIVKTVCVGKDPLKVVERCIELRNSAIKDDKAKEYDSCVCLVDVDQHSTLNQALKLAADEGIIVLVSNLKFEVWLRWHAEEKRSQLSSRQLDDLMSRLGLLEKKRLAGDFPIHKVGFACTQALAADPGLAAGRIGPDPSSAMPVLVDMM